MLTLIMKSKHGRPAAEVRNMFAKKKVLVPKTAQDKRIFSNNIIILSQFNNDGNFHFMK